MALNTTSGALCITRATATGTTMKAKEDSSRPSEPPIKDIDSAMGYLIMGDLKEEEDELSFESLSIIAMQLSQQSRFPKHTLDAFRALSYLIFDLQQKRTVGKTMDVIAKAVSVATKRVHNKLKDATELVSAVAITANNAAEELCEECHVLVAEIRDAVEGAFMALANRENELGCLSQQGEERVDNPRGMYMESIRK